jgi:outer membrane receptor for ferrienterochelin and colicin
MKIGRLLIALACISTYLYAGTTGKIAGKIVDASSGEPLIGAIVVVEGTTLGAATDVEGEYYIINIPPGMYTLSVRMIGYRTKVVEKVRVQVDLTTRINLGLDATTVELNAVTVTSTRREVQRDLSSSERTMQPDQIQVLPARDVTSILSIQAGVTRDANGDLHIRGGRTSEISYMVDGVQILNPLNRSAGISVDDQSIEELKAITGTFNAEYGQALSGVVNIVTKQGTEKFVISATAYSGDFLSFDEQLYSVMNNRAWAEAAARSLTTKSGRFSYDFRQDGITSVTQLIDDLRTRNKRWEPTTPYLTTFHPFRHYDMQVNTSGPLVYGLSFFAAGRYQHQPGYEQGRRYFMPWGIWTPASDTVHTFAQPDGALVPLNWYDGYSTQSKISWNSGDFNIGYGLYYNNDHSYSGGQKYLPDGGRNYYTDRFTHLVTLTYLFSPSTFANVKGSYYSNDNKSYLYEDPFDYRYMPTQAGDFQQFMFRPDREADVQVNNNTDDFTYWGNDVNRSQSTVRYFSSSIDLTSQADKYNLLKFGVSGRLHNLKNDYYALQFSQVDYRPIIPEVSSPYHTYYKAKPYEFAAYVQDKIEFEELIINIGLRYDYFYSDGRILTDPADPQIYSPFKLDNIYRNYSPTTPQSSLVERTVAERKTFWYKKTDPKYQVSPRVGISFPVTADAVLHFSYGHFFQNPEFQFLYTNPNFWITGAGAQNLAGNANLNAERTVMYEVGLQQKMSELLMNVTAFYRDIRDWVGTGTPIDTYRGLTYYTYVNKDNAVAKGITLSGSYIWSDFNFSLDYTYMEAMGTSSNPSDAYNDLTAGRAPRVDLVNLNWSQPHALNIVTSYATSGWTATLVASTASGFPYTPSIIRGEATGSNSYTGWRENSQQKPATLNFDLHVSKMIAIGVVKTQAILDVTNLFDTRNARNVYNDTGLPDYTLQDYQNWTRFVEISNSTEYYRNPGYYSPPRSITLGLRFFYD